MPTYPFWCDTCEFYVEDIRSMHDAASPMICAKCGKVMDRIYTAPNVSISIPAEGYYNYGLGKYISRKSDISEAQRQYRDTHGSDLIEVGNERIKARPPASKYKLPSEVVQHMASDAATLSSTKTMLERCKNA